ncbi:biotin/lipoyl-containing protein [Spongiimicrobium sp. 3-5]|uniref:biotin/lipoyl-containing protein n=1 Tax=Spongiimicrobium sp. 3-5 TaxID=3332596 RepID=UPI003980C8E2
MENSFKAIVNNDMELDVSMDDVSKTDVFNTAPNKYHILKDNKPYNVEIIHSDFNSKRYTVNVNGNLYTVNLQDELDQLIKEMGFEIGTSKDVGSIEAPMPGLILDVAVDKKQQVKEGDTLLILEAMKMENIITSPRDGIIKSIAVSKGEAVVKKQLLIAFE